MIHPSTSLRYINPVIGYGVVATSFIPEGTITWAIDDLDQVLAPEQAETFPDIFQRPMNHFTYRDSLGSLILCWDITRYMNHDCQPSCLGTDYGFEIAIRDIEPGEQLTVDYATLHLHLDESFSCFCASPLCRKRVSPLDVDIMASKWSRQFRWALGKLGAVDQPLGSLVRSSALGAACAANGVALPAPFSVFQVLQPMSHPLNGHSHHSHAESLAPGEATALAD